jgi:outer membrane protein OmpA-like peptidoglycan-associated protein
MEKEAKKELKRIIDFLKANPNIEVSIVGYASKIQEDNRLNLAQARAEKVLEELRQANIASARMNAKGSKELGIDKRVKVVIDKIN